MAKCPHPAIIFTYRRTLIEVVIPALLPDLDHLERIRRRFVTRARARARKEKGRKRRDGREGTRIWPLQLEERGKAEVANPCKEPLYFLKEVLRAPDALPPSGPREKDGRGLRDALRGPGRPPFIPLLFFVALV